MKTMRSRLKPLRYNYNVNDDVLTVEDVKYSGSLFRTLGLGATPMGRWIRITDKVDGVVTIQERTEDEIVRIWQDQHLPKTE